MNIQRRMVKSAEIWLHFWRKWERESRKPRQAETHKNAVEQIKLTEAMLSEWRDSLRAFRRQRRELRRMRKVVEKKVKIFFLKSIDKSI